jgi:hypothetical protein
MTSFVMTAIISWVISSAVIFQVVKGFAGESGTAFWVTTLITWGFGAFILFNAVI